ncbi:MAG TPA: transcription antitermination factor NusB [Gammaproteobacteria bacterium]|nr:transcription antitermination factor NusB [Gammaproteobacteria bacterium]MEC8010241.1 transcription antitermination factor NusB [Pseudomonadota bacterium]HBF06732.1 transcription antitermination factor NusB [Gammaproteobacteria bacterium]HCK92170.1 transcription antitermination factor NusB [Gammaproteobacteria bacterium]|tara:strand:- start:1968 stop:2435 length:468 start_codon:yes stop_codon:yes gene_type:complete
MSGNHKAVIAQRKKARFIAVQALYQWLIAETPLNELLAQSRMDNVKKAGDWSFFDTLVAGVVRSSDALDERYVKSLDRPFDQISPIEKSIIRLGVFELLNCPETPYVVVVNEYVELAKMFGATDSYKYVNSILHAVGTETRELEIAAYEAQKGTQ